MPCASRDRSRRRARRRDSRAALDALSAIRVKYDPKPFVVDVATARKAGAPLVFAGQVENKTSAGDMPGAAQAAPARRQRAGPAQAATRATSTKDSGRRMSSSRAPTSRRSRRTRLSRPTASWPPGSPMGASRSGPRHRASSPCATSWPRRLRVSTSRRSWSSTEYMGGGFGAKFGAGVEGVTAAKLAKEAGLPVKLFLDRKDEHLAVGNRPSAIQWIKAGATKDGKLTGAAPRGARQRRDQRRDGHVRATEERLCLRQRQDRGVRRLHQLGPFGRFPGSRPSAGLLRPRNDDGRARGQARDGPARVPNEERPLGGPARGVLDRRREDRLEGPRRAARDGGPRDPPRRRHGSGRLVQHRRHGPQGHGHDLQGRLGRCRAGRAGPGDGRPHDGRHRGGRGARTAPRKSQRAHRRLRHALRPGLRRLDDDAVLGPVDPRRRLAGQAESRRGPGEGLGRPANEQVEIGRASSPSRATTRRSSRGRRPAPNCPRRACRPRPRAPRTTTTPGSGSRPALSSPRSRWTRRPAASGS